MIRARRTARLMSQVMAALFAIGTFVSTTAVAQTQTQTQSDAWKFNAYIYGYLPDISGSTTFRTGTTANLSVDASDIISHLKFTFMGWLEAQKGQVGLFTDILYLDVGGSKTGTRDISIGGGSLPAGITADANLDIKATLWTLAGSYRFVATPEAGFDLLAGARMIDMKQNLGWQFSADVGPFVGPGRQGSSEVSITHWDAIVGAKGRFSFGDRREWYVPYYIDVGAGQDKLTWQAFAGVGYNFSWGDVVAVWRYIDYRFDKDDASLKMNGPAIGVGFHW